MLAPFTLKVSILFHQVLSPSCALLKQHPLCVSTPSLVITAIFFNRIILLSNEDNSSWEFLAQVPNGKFEGVVFPPRFTTKKVFVVFMVC